MVTYRPTNGQSTVALGPDASKTADENISGPALLTMAQTFTLHGRKFQNHAVENKIQFLPIDEVQPSSSVALQI